MLPIFIASRVSFSSLQALPLASIPFHDINPVLFKITENFQIRWYGVMYVVGFALGIGILKWMIHEKTTPFGPKAIEILLLPALLSVLNGARVGFFLFYDQSTLFAHPLTVLNITTGGMSFHGGLIGFVFASWYLSHKTKRPLITVGEQYIIGGTIALAPGRLGNFINGELYGRVTHVPWAIRFPVYRASDLLKRGYVTVFEKIETGYRYYNLQHVSPKKMFEHYLYQIDGNGTYHLIQPLGRHPSQLYEMLLEGLVLGILVFLLRRQIRKPGRIASIFLIGYGFSRYLIEFTREPTPISWWSIEAQKYFTMGQALCLLMILAGIALWLKSRKFQDLSGTIPAFGGNWPRHLLKDEASVENESPASDTSDPTSMHNVNPEENDSASKS